MTRSLTSGMVTAAQASSGDVAHLISLAFSGGTQYLTTATHDIAFGGNTYVAVGGHLTFEVVTESPELLAQSVRLELDGVDQTIISPLLAQNYIGRVGLIYLAHIGTDGLLVTDPELIFSGLINNKWVVIETGETAIVKTTLTSNLVHLRQVRGIRADVTSHGMVFSGDTFFSHITAITNRIIWWGGRPVRVGGGGDTQFDERDFFS